MIHKIEIDNFCTIDNVTIDLSQDKSVMVVGGSGSGKSSLVGSIFAALYGSFPDKPDASLYNDVMDKTLPAKMSITLDIGNDVYTIDRKVIYAEDKTQAYVYDSNGNRVVGPQIKGVQAWISTHLMDKNTFLSLYFLSQKSKHDLCDISPSEGSKILFNLLGMNGLQDYVTKFSNIARESEKSNINFQRQLSGIESAKSSLINKKAEKRAIEVDIQKAETELASITSFLDQTNQSQSFDIINEKEKEKITIEGEIKRLNALVLSLTNSKNKIQESINTSSSVPCIENGSHVYPSCPFLQVNKFYDEIASINEEIINNTKELDDLTDKLSSILIFIADLKIDEDDLNIQSKRIISLSERNILTATLNEKNKQLGRIESEIEALDKMIVKESIIKNELDSSSVAYDYSSFISKSLSRSGGPSIILNEALPDINNICNNICINHSVPFSFNINSTKEMKSGESIDSLNILLKDDNGKERHVSTFSGGERQIAQLILRFAIQEYLANKFGKQQFNIMCGDEIWSQMDSSMTDICYNIISNQAHFDQVIIVSHSFGLTSRFDKIINVNKINGITKFTV